MPAAIAGVNLPQASRDEGVTGAGHEVVFEAGGADRQTARSLVFSRGEKIKKVESRKETAGMTGDAGLAESADRRGSTFSSLQSPALPFSTMVENGRDDRIRTCDLLTPSQTRYQTALHPDLCFRGGIL